MTTDRRNACLNPRAVSLLVLVFLCGAAAGALAMRTGIRRAQRPGLYLSSGSVELSLERFKTELRLRPEQVEQVRALLRDFGMYFQSLQAQMTEVRATGKNKILEVLDDRQKQKFERMMTELAKR